MSYTRYVDLDEDEEWLWNFDHGDSGESDWGVASNTLSGAEASPGSNKVKATSFVEVAGWGGVTTWSSIESEFVPRGTEDEARNFKVYFRGNGHVVTFGGNSAKAEVSLFVKNLDKDWEPTSEVVATTDAMGVWAEGPVITNTVTGEVTENLVPGDTYVAGVKLECQANVYGVGAVSSADFGPFDGDEGYIDVEGIEITPP